MPGSRWSDWRTYASLLGRILVATGLLLLGFVGYQLWGTGIQTARAQSSLENEFTDLLADSGGVPPVDTTAAPVTTEDPTVTVERPPSQTLPVPGLPGGPDSTTVAPPATSAPPVSADLGAGLVPTGTGPAPGDPVTRLEIPRLGLDKIVVSGVDTSSLRKGPGHYPQMAFPGEVGNAGIAGHRTTYGAPFEQLDRLEPGDEIVTTTPAGRFVYRVRSTEIVAPSDSWVLNDTGEAILTLTTCHPRFSTAQRLIVVADLDAPASDPTLARGLTASWFGEGAGPPVPGTTVGPTVPTTSGETTVPGPATSTPGDAATTTPGDPATSTPGDPATSTPGEAATTAPAGPPTSAEVAPDATGSGAADAFARGWFSDPAAWPQVALWGAALTLLGLLAWGVSRWSRHNWVGALVFVGPFLFVLYFWYENVARLLPPNL